MSKVQKGKQAIGSKLSILKDIISILKIAPEHIFSNYIVLFCCTVIHKIREGKTSLLYDLFSVDLTFASNE